MLLGNAVFHQNRYISNEKNMLLAREGLTKNSIQFNSQYRTFQSDLIPQDTSQHAKINYSQYELVDEVGLLPQLVTIAIQQAEENLQMELNYQNIRTNKIPSFPFKIPRSYIRK
jgi:hypothetical protein